MKLAVYCPDFFPLVSGYSFAFQDLVQGLCAEGVEVDVFTPVALGASQELVVPGLRVTRIRHAEPLRHIKYLRALLSLLNKPRQTAAAISAAHARRGYDAVLFETIEDPLVVLSLPAGLRARSVVRVHGCAETELAMWDPSALWRFKHWLIVRALTLHIRYITSTTDFYLEFVRHHFLKNNALVIADKRFTVVPNSAPRLSSTPRPVVMPNSRRRFMTLGRMNWVGANQKGFDDILMALHELTPEQRASIHLTVIGQGDEQPRLRTLAGSIPDVEIDFIAGLPNAQIRKLLSEVDGVILASRYEGMSVFALEAVGSGAPVIFSDAGGIAGLVQDNGRCFAAGDPCSLAIAWGEMLTATPQQWQNMSQASVAVAAELTPQLAARKLIRFLKVVLPQAQRACSE
jgi:glycosyltransferase involved in cell wall biosynthesis